MLFDSSLNGTEWKCLPFPLKCFLYKALYVQCIKYAYDKNKQILRSVNSYPEITALDAAINLHAYV